MKYNIEKDGYLVEAAADLNKQAPYLSVQRKYGKQVYKAHYAFKEEYAMIETGYAQTEGDLPLVKACLQACTSALLTKNTKIGFCCIPGLHSSAKAVCLVELTLIKRA